MKIANALLVEGNDDQHVIWSLLLHHKVPETFVVKETGGIDNLMQTLPVQIKGSGVTSVGIVLDADFNIEGRWQALRVLLLKAGYKTCPVQPIATGTILQEDGLPRFGAWLMPNNLLPGMLEDFVSCLIPTEDKLWPLATGAVTAIPAGDRPFILQHETKAKVHTWLAWQEDPGTPMGLAVTKRYLDAEAPSAIPFLNWLGAVF